MGEDVRSDLRAYYEEEARLGTRRSLRGRRVELRTQFIELLQREGRGSVVDFGAGPGHDGDGFIAANIDYLGVDLAHGNGALAAERGVTVVQGSLDAPPFRPGSSAAGWSMSTLMHLPEADVPVAVKAMAAVLAAGAPLCVGQWGGPFGDHVDDTHLEGHRRLFSHRSFERNRELLELIGDVEQEQTWLAADGTWNYHVFVVRTR